MLLLASPADGTLSAPFAGDLTVDDNGNLYVLSAGLASNSILSFEGVYKIAPSGAMTLYGGAVTPTYPVPAVLARRLGTPVGIALAPGPAGSRPAVVADRTGRVLQLTP